MAFGVFPIFNFYQQPNTGATGGPLPEITAENSGIVFGDNMRSGTVADFNWYYPYAKTNYNEFLLRASKVFHIFEIWADAALTGVGSVDVNSSFSGKFGATGNVNTFSTKWEGFITPMDKNEFTWWSNFSGQISGKETPRVTFTSIYSGLTTGQNYDRPTILSKMSGKLGATGNRCFINSAYSGIISGIVPDAVTWVTSFSGKITPLSSDTASISYQFESFATGENVHIIRGSGQSEASITYVVSEIAIVVP